MNHLNARCILPLLLVPTISGCSDNSSGESAGGKWLDAPKVLADYLANTELIISGRDREGCPAVIETIRKQLAEGASTFGTSAVLEVCSNAGLQFGDKVRCEGKRLLVNCK
jgi:hypothetical protein